MPTANTQMPIGKVTRWSYRSNMGPIKIGPPKLKNVWALSDSHQTRMGIFPKSISEIHKPHTGEPPTLHTCSASLRRLLHQHSHGCKLGVRIYLIDARIFSLISEWSPMQFGEFLNTQHQDKKFTSKPSIGTNPQFIIKPWAYLITLFWPRY